MDLEAFDSWYHLVGTITGWAEQGSRSKPPGSAVLSCGAVHYGAISQTVLALCTGAL